MSNQVYSNDTVKYSSLVNPTNVVGSIGSAFAPVLPWVYSYNNDNGLITITFDTASGVTQFGSTILQTSLLPAAARPRRTLQLPLTVLRNSLIELGTMEINPSGLITITGQGTFAIGTTCGLPGQSWSYASF